MHIPVLLSPILALLEGRSALTIVDGTFGQGGYTQAFLERGHRVIAFDRDPEAVPCAIRFKEQYGDRFLFIQSPFSKLENYVQELVDVVVFDLGVSSPQIDTPERGFSVRFDGPLDMRMSQDGLSAKEVVNTFSETQIADIIYKYGEDHDSRRIAKLIVQFRAQKEIETTSELVSIISKVNPHPKKAFDSVIRAFQGIRIYVNNELEELKQGLDAAGQVLKSGGLLMAVSFHSLEDRIVKMFMKTALGSLPSSRYIPFTHENDATFRGIGKSFIVPGHDELSQNPRARSAKLRVAIRTDLPWKGEKGV